MKTRYKTIASLFLSLSMAGCANMNGPDGNMNNATKDAGLGAVAGGVAGGLASAILCKGNVACRNTMIATGAVVGMAIGYKTGYERDLEVAMRMQDDLRTRGYQPELITQEVTAQIPTNAATGKELTNEEASSLPQQQIAYKPKKVKKLEKLSVQMKNKNDPKERAELSNYLMENANKMNATNERKVLTVPAPTSSQDRTQLASLTQLARQQNMVVKEDRKTSSYTIASM